MWLPLGTVACTDHSSQHTWLPLHIHAERCRQSPMYPVSVIRKCVHSTPDGPQWEPYLWCMGASMSSPQMQLPLGTAHHGSISSPQIWLPLGTAAYAGCKLFFTTDAVPTGDHIIWKHLLTTDATPIGDCHSNRNWYLITTWLLWGTVVRNIASTY
jgi:hypothetical protein